MTPRLAPTFERPLIWTPLAVFAIVGLDAPGLRSVEAARGYCATRINEP